MRLLISAVLYTALLATANAAERTELEALRDGSMQKLVFADPAPATEEPFTTEDGQTASLSDYAGKHVLLNFWATWCAPCRKEMPALDALQAEFGGDAFEVVTVATGRNSPEGMRRFFEETGVENLPLHSDPKSAMARDMGILGLPVTVLIDPEGREIARLMGDAEWHGDSARAIIEALIGSSGD